MLAKEVTGRVLSVTLLSLVLLGVIIVAGVGTTDAASISEIDYDSGTAPSDRMTIIMSGTSGSVYVDVTNTSTEEKYVDFVMASAPKVNVTASLVKGPYLVEVYNIGLDLLASQTTSIYNLVLNYDNLTEPIANKSTLVSEDVFLSTELDDKYLWSASEEGGDWITTPTLEMVSKYACTLYAFDRTEVTITADDASKIYGNDDPEFTVTISPEVSFDFEYEITRAPGKDVGTYAITVTGDETQGIYHITFASGKLTINPKEVSVPEIEIEVVAYDGAEHTTDVPAGDDYTVTQATGTAVGVYKATLVLKDKGNYVWETTEKEKHLPS